MIKNREISSVLTCSIWVLSLQTRSEPTPGEEAAKPKPGEAIVSVGVPATVVAKLDGMASGARVPFVFPSTSTTHKLIPIGELRSFTKFPTAGVLPGHISTRLLGGLHDAHSLLFEEVHLGLELLVAILYPLKVVYSFILFQPRLADSVPEL